MTRHMPRRLIGILRRSLAAFLCRFTRLIYWQIDYRDATDIYFHRFDRAFRIRKCYYVYAVDLPLQRDIIAFTFYFSLFHICHEICDFHIYIALEPRLSSLLIAAANSRDDWGVKASLRFRKEKFHIARGQYQACTPLHSEWAAVIQIYYYGHWILAHAAARHNALCTYYV